MVSPKPQDAGDTPAQTAPASMPPPEKSFAPLKCVSRILGKCNQNVEKMSRAPTLKVVEGVKDILDIPTTKMYAGDIF